MLRSPRKPRFSGVQSIFCKGEGACFQAMVALEPVDEADDPLFKLDGGVEVEKAGAFFDICECFDDLAWLHGEEFFDRFFAEGLFEKLDEIEKIDRPVIPKIENFIWRAKVDGGASPFHDVIDVGEIAPHLAPIKDLDWLALANMLRESVVGHIRPPPRAVCGEVAERSGRESI